MLMGKNKKAGAAGKWNKILITVNVIGSAGPMRFVVDERETVRSVIEMVLKSYAREGRLPILGSDIDGVVMFCPGAESDGQFLLEDARKHLNILAKEVARLKIAEKNAIEKIKKTGETEETKELIAKIKADIEEKIKEPAETKVLIAKREKDVDEVYDRLKEKLLVVGNLVHDSVPVSDDEANNAVFRTWGEKRIEPNLKNHVELVELLGIADTKKGADVVGGRGFYLKGDGVLLNEALISFGLAFLMQRGYTPLHTPLFLRRDILKRYAQLAQFGTV